jgi:hypothetical protein
MCCVQLCYAKLLSRGGALARFPATPLGCISPSSPSPPPITTIHCILTTHSFGVNTTSHAIQHQRDNSPICRSRLRGLSRPRNRLLDSVHHPCELTRPLASAGSASPLDSLSAGVGLLAPEGWFSAVQWQRRRRRRRWTWAGAQESRLLESLGGRVLCIAVRRLACCVPRGTGKCTLYVG